MYCTELSLVNHSNTAGTLSVLRCKRWSCPYCRPINRNEVIRKAAEGEPNVFMTLTCRPNSYESPDEAARDMKRGLVALRRRIERKWKIKNIPFVVVFEKHKSGWPHMHLMMRATYMHWKVLRAMWRDIIGAYQVDIRNISKKKNYRYYITKYIGKDVQGFEGTKRWWRSHNYSLAPKDDVKPFRLLPRFEILRQPYRHVLINLSRNGWEIEKVGKHKYSLEPPPGRTYGRWREAFSLDHIGSWWSDEGEQWA